MEVEATLERTLRVWWGLMWRNLAVSIAAMVCGALVGAILGLGLGALGLPLEIIQVIAFPLGLCIGLAFSILAVRMVLGRQFGDFRLVLISTRES